jgi:DNA-binding transcriptional LysR family regulator
MAFSELTMALADRLRVKQLKLIVALGEQGTLRRAATAINVTQPTATKMLSELEGVLGMALYERGPRGLTANGYGREMVACAARVMSEFERLMGALEARRGGGVGELVVGAILGTTADVIARAVIEMKERQPLLDIHLRGETSDSVIALLERRIVDLAVGRFPASARDGLYAYEPLGEEALCIVGRQRHPLASARRLRLADLAEQRWVMHSTSNPARQILDREFGKAGVAPPRDIIEANSILTVLKILEYSDAVAMLSEPLVRDQVRVGLLRRLPVRIDARLSGFGLLTRRGEALKGASADFAERLRAVAKRVAMR